MTDATYIGTADDRETELVKVFGLEFPKGEAVDVSGLTDARLAKLRGNGTFAVDGDPMWAATSVAELNPGAVEIPADWDGLPFQALAALARKIDPSLDRTAKKDECIGVIEIELGRRAAEA